MSTRYAAVVGTLLLLATACSDPSAPGKTPQEIKALPRALSPAEQGIITAANSFGFRWRARVSADTPAEHRFRSRRSA